jgi:hypothetical protein
MPRYVVERTFPEGPGFAAAGQEEGTWMQMVERNEDEDVTWIQTYVSEDRRKWFCLYEAPTPEAIRRAATKNDLPVDRITQVRVLDPYLYAG